MWIRWLLQAATLSALATQVAGIPLTLRLQLQQSLHLHWRRGWRLWLLQQRL